MVPEKKLVPFLPKVNLSSSSVVFYNKDSIIDNLYELGYQYYTSLKWFTWFKIVLQDAAHSAKIVRTTLIMKNNQQVPQEIPERKTNKTHSSYTSKCR